MICVGIDTGGTFTDVAAYDPETGAIRVTKVPSNPDRPDEAVVAALGALEVDSSAIDRLVYGTTVATNALLQRCGARLAVIMTEGFRDTLEIGRTRRSSPGLFNTKAVRPPPLIPRCARFEVAERMLADGRVLRQLDEPSFARTLDAVAAWRPEGIVVCLLHAYANPVHERRVGEILAERFPGVPVQLSSDLLPEYREYERLSTAVINAYVLPLVSGYLTRLASRISLDRRRLFLMSSSGGTMTAETAAREPARTFLSGPAGGVHAAILVARVAKVETLITCDMGGTSTDVSFIRGLSAEIVGEAMIEGLPLRLPQLEISTVGAGGGSVAWFDVDGALRIGPKSVGSVPGPVCYGQGGTQPTVTDASLYLGRLGEDSLLAGGLRVDRDLAAVALGALAREAGLSDLDRFVDGILRLAVARMVGAISEISIERGYDPRQAVLVPMGGAGPMYAADIAREMGIQRILVPPHPGNMSAIGLLGADIRHDLIRTWIAALPDLDVEALERRVAALREDGLALLAADGFAEDRSSLEPAVDVRYRGQAFELTVPLDEPFDLRLLERSFHRLYETRYGFRPEGRTAEVVALRMVARGRVPSLRFGQIPARGKGPDAARKATRAVYFDGRRHADCPIYRRDGLGSATTLTGPAVIEEFGSTTVLPPGWRAEINPWGHIIMERG